MWSFKKTKYQIKGFRCSTLKLFWIYDGELFMKIEELFRLKPSCHSKAGWASDLGQSVESPSVEFVQKLL